MVNDKLLRQLPSVDELLRSDALKDVYSLCSHAVIAEAARETLSAIRIEINSNGISEVSLQEIIALTKEKINALLRPGVKRVINATGTLLHTNMGRAVLSRSAVDAVALAARSHTNLEFEIETGGRGLRDNHVEGLLKMLTGAEAACVVNNNAAAVFITLNTLAAGKEVIISRGELVEIGGSFRLHEIIGKSGCVLKEVGTTNRTHPQDYSRALTPQTALLLKAHKSNFTMAGFTAEVDLKELVSIGHANSLPGVEPLRVVEDLGSGSLFDLSTYGLPKEPVVRERFLAGADIVTFSGDKLLGGPQAGLICGKQGLIRRINENPLKRVLRADKLTIAALEATLRLYLNEATLTETLPVLAYMTRTVEEIDRDAQKAAALLKAALGEGFCVRVEDGESVIGGGSMPGHNLLTKVVAITHEKISAMRISRIFLANDPPIAGRVNSGSFLLDMRTVDRPEDVVPSG